MAEEKKLTSIRISPTILRELKMLGVTHDRPLGDVIAALLWYAMKAPDYISHEESKDFLRVLRDQAFASTRNRSFWVGEPEPPETHYDPSEGTDD
ncbi:MAG: hypothetical protein CVT74_02320 [Alphaproteobacteria bacterium HGW-Alphaproteobacteria-13]|jgi:hypothetical protein|nr:MAG: hypothetical protein CVT74_02320 [Alphaproteobacteria bacterium HGW-Alphaproteobacteria-13]